MTPFAGLLMMMVSWVRIAFSLVSQHFLYCPDACVNATQETSSPASTTVGNCLLTDLTPALSLVFWLSSLAMHIVRSTITSVYFDTSTSPLQADFVASLDHYLILLQQPHHPVQCTHTEFGSLVILH